MDTQLQYRGYRGSASFDPITCQHFGHESIKTTEKYYAKWVKARQDRLDKLVMESWG